MKILYLLSQRPDSTGSGFYVRAMISEALKRGHDCYLVAGVSGDAVIDFLPPENCSLVRFEGADLPFPIAGMSDVMPYKSTRFIDMTDAEISEYKNKFKQAVCEAVNTFQPDIIHSNHLWIMSAVAKEACPDIPVITSCHGTDLRQIINCGHLKDEVTSSCLKMDGILALSQIQKQEIASLIGISESKISVAGIGFNDDIFYSGKKNTPPPVNLLYAGKLSAAKGVPLLLQAVSRLKEFHIPFHLYLAGSGTGDDFEACKSLAEAAGKQITLCGALKQEQLADLMRKSHIFILPSFFEGLPLVLFEALASGCKIITTDLPGTMEILGDTGSDFVRFLKLPDLETIDSPFASDIPQLVHSLSEIIKEEIEKSIKEPDICMDKVENLIKNHRWEEIFKKVECCYVNSLYLN